MEWKTPEAVLLSGDRFKTNLQHYQIDFRYEKRQLRKASAPKFLVETGEAWNPSHRNILSLLKQRRALAVEFKEWLISSLTLRALAEMYNLGV